MRAKDAEHRPGKRAFASAFVALKNENGLANYVGALESVGEPAFDVETGLRIACAKYLIDMIVHQLPTTLLWKHSKPAPEVEAVVGKDLRLLWAGGGPIVRKTARRTVAKHSCRDF